MSKAASAKIVHLASESSAPQYLENLIQEAEQAYASDIHLQMLGADASVSFRLDGVMGAPRKLPADLADRVFGRIKFLAKLKTYQESLPRDGRIDKADVSASAAIFTWQPHPLEQDCAEQQTVFDKKLNCFGHRSRSEQRPEYFTIGQVTAASPGSSAINCGHSDSLSR